MNFLAAVAAFFGAIWLTYYIFVTLDEFLLGLGGIALVGILFLQLIVTVRSPTND